MPTQHPDNLHPQNTRTPTWLLGLVAWVFMLMVGLQPQSHALQNEWQSHIADAGLDNRSPQINSPLGLYLLRDTPAQRSAEQNQSPEQPLAASNGPQTLPLISHHAVPELTEAAPPFSAHGRSQPVRAPPVL